MRRHRPNLSLSLAFIAFLLLANPATALPIPAPAPKLRFLSVPAAAAAAPLPEPLPVPVPPPAPYHPRPIPGLPGAATAPVPGIFAENLVRLGGPYELVVGRGGSGGRNGDRLIVVPGATGAGGGGGASVPAPVSGGGGGGFEDLVGGGFEIVTGTGDFVTGSGNRDKTGSARDVLSAARAERERRRRKTVGKAEMEGGSWPGKGNRNGNDDGKKNGKEVEKVDIIGLEQVDGAGGSNVMWTVAPEVTGPLSKVQAEKPLALPKFEGVPEGDSAPEQPQPEHNPAPNTLPPSEHSPPLGRHSHSHSHPPSTSGSPLGGGIDAAAEQIIPPTSPLLVELFPPAHTTTTTTHAHPPPNPHPSPLIDPTTQWTYPPSPISASHDPDNFPTTLLEPVSALDKEDPLPGLRMWAGAGGWDGMGGEEQQRREMYFSTGQGTPGMEISEPDEPIPIGDKPAAPVAAYSALETPPQGDSRKPYIPALRAASPPTVLAPPKSPSTATPYRAATPVLPPLPPKLPLTPSTYKPSPPNPIPITLPILLPPPPAHSPSPATPSSPPLALALTPGAHPPPPPAKSAPPTPFSTPTPRRPFSPSLFPPVSPQTAPASPSLLAYPQSQLDPLSVVDSDDPLPTLRKWGEAQQAAAEWAEMNAQTGRNDGGSRTPRHERQAEEKDKKSKKSTPGTPRATPEDSGTPRYPHPQSPGWQVFGGLNPSLGKKERKGVIMVEKLGAPARDKWGFVKWSFDTSEQGVGLKGLLMEWGGEMLGSLVAGRFGGF